MDDCEEFTRRYYKTHPLAKDPLAFDLASVIALRDYQWRCAIQEAADQLQQLLDDP